MPVDCWCGKMNRPLCRPWFPDHQSLLHHGRESLATGLLELGSDGDRQPRWRAEALGTGLGPMFWGRYPLLPIYAENILADFILPWVSASS